MSKSPHLRLVVDKPSLERLWQDFVALKRRSEETLAIEDGIAAGQAYGAFLRAAAAEEAA